MRKMASGEALFNSPPFFWAAQDFVSANRESPDFHEYLAPSSLGTLLLLCTFLNNHQLKAQPAKGFSACFPPKRIFVFPIDQDLDGSTAPKRLTVQTQGAYKTCKSRHSIQIRTGVVI